MFSFSLFDKNKKATAHPINKKDKKCFQNAVTLALNHGEIKKEPQRITKIKPFINKHNWEIINYASEKDDWKKIMKNNEHIALNVLYSKKKKYILLMFQNITQIAKSNLFF